MTNPAPALAISGKRYFGKDRLAAVLVEHAQARGKPLLRCALADQAKLAFVELQEQQGQAVDLGRLSSDRAYKEQWRPQLTEFTEAELAKDPQVFIKRLFATQLPEGTGLYLISDVRLACEVDYLRERGGAFLARIDCDDDTRKGFGWAFKEGVDDHFTETQLDGRTDWDAHVQNPGTPEGLATNADALLDRFLGQL